ncbi:hypothetical protein EV646_111145 [Kribbella antiqua]|uniref:Uncharacterized protein n=1 Tax=Kribbella antiqua TaxID=2512217 RepID=A0A4R2IGR4_9ACTN|nr:hypothetical protein [Kribbella antiqua]TCO43953.1 hypothetical protein EV646_111145 [Kribbella antiqua]
MFKLLKEIAAGINAASAIRHGLEPPAAALDQPAAPKQASSAGSVPSKAPCRLQRG